MSIHCFLLDFELERFREIQGRWLTVCITRAGAGGGTPSDWENAEA